MVNVQIMLCVMFTKQQSLHASPPATLLRDAKIVLYFVIFHAFLCQVSHKRGTCNIIIYTSAHIDVG
jgi:hypothetical protein